MSRPFAFLTDCWQHAKAFSRSLLPPAVPYAEHLVPDTQPFYHLLPTRLYDPEHQVYVNSRSVMQAIEVPLLTGADEKLITSLVSAVNQLDSEVFVQCLRVTHTQTGDRLAGIEADLAQPGGLFAELAKRQAKYYHRATLAGLPNKLGNYYGLMDSRVFWFLSLPSDQSNQAQKTEQLKQVTEHWLAELRTSNLTPTRVRPPEFLGLMRSLSYPQFDQAFTDTDFNPLELLNEQCRTHEQRLTVEPDHLRFESDERPWCASVFTVKKNPDVHALWQTANYLAAAERATSVQSPHAVSLSFKLIPALKAKGHANLKRLRLEKVAHSAMSKWLPRLKDQYNEWQSLYNALDRDEVRICEAFMSVIVWAPESDFKPAVKALTSTFLADHFELQCVKQFQLPLYLATLPGHLANDSWLTLKTCGQIRKLTSWNVVNLLPMVGDWKGTPSGVVTSGLHNQLCALDLFELPVDNWNVCVAAAPGAGKSVACQTLVMNVLSSRGKVYIIDKGGSYKKLCQLLGGRYLEAGSLRLNPFSYLDQIEDPDDLALSLNVVREFIVALADPDQAMTAVNRAYLLEAVELAYQSAGVEANIDTVVAMIEQIQQRKLKESDQRVPALDDVKQLLKQYMTTGLYGKYFNTFSDLDPKAPLIVLEMGGLNENTELRDVVLFSLINLISQQMYLTDRNLKKLCLIDEAWELLDGNNEQHGRFIEAGFRTSRKHRGSFCVIRQDADGYLSGKTAKACWDSADIKLLMRQGEGTLDSLREKLPSFLSDAEVALVNQFKPSFESGFSSLLIKAGQLSAVQRLFIDPFSKVLYSTKANEFQAVEQCQAQGATLMQAIESTAREFHGEELAWLEQASSTQQHPVNQQEENRQ